MNKITNKQIFYILFISMTAYNVVSIPYTMSRAAGRGGWTSVVAASLIFALSSLFVSGLNKMYEGKILAEYGSEIVGKFFSYVVLLYYFIYFIIIFVYLECQIINLINAEFLLKTPKFVIAFIGIAVIGYISYKGVISIARLLEILVPLFIIFSVIIFTMALFQGLDYNLMPVYEPSKLSLYIKGIIPAIIPFLGAEVMFAIPFSKDNKKPSLLLFSTIIFVGLYYVLTIQSSIKILGVNTVSHYKTAVIEAFRMVEIPLLERVDILYLTLGFSGLILGTTTVYMAASEILCKVFPKIRRDVAMACIGIVLYALVMVGDIMFKDISKTFGGLITVLGLISAAALPVILFIIAKVRKNVKKSS